MNFFATDAYPGVSDQLCLINCSFGTPRQKGRAV